MKRIQIMIMIIAASAALGLGGCSKTADSTKEQETARTEAEESKMIKIDQTTEAETSIAPTEPETSAAVEETTAVQEPEETKKEPEETKPAKVYKVTAVNNTMYATRPVYARKSYTKGSDVLTCLGTGQKVEVTGMAANGWMRIVYKGQDAFVYKAYLSEEKPTEKKETEAPKAAETETAVNSAPGGTVSAPGGAAPAPSGQQTNPIVVPSPGTEGSNQTHLDGPGGNASSGNVGPGFNLDEGLTSGPGGGSSPSGGGTGVVTSAGPGGA